MLGRLFRQNSYGSQGSGGANVGQNHSSVCSNLNSYDDAYTREILYGTTNANQLSPSQLSAQLFRIVVCQDGGNLRNKQILFDSSQDLKTSGVKPQSFMAPPKQGHNTNELNDYMFGCGLPTSESHSCTKLHVLPTLNSMAYGSSESVLITRLFSVHEEAPSEEIDMDWNPRSTLPVRNKVSVHSTDTINSRFSIGLILTLESLDDFHDIIFNNWDEISQFLIVLQRLLIKKMIMHLNSNPSLVINKRIQFPPHFFQSEADLHGQLIKLVKLVHYNSNIPKLINSNVMMQTKTEANKYQSLIFNWILEVLNWLEFKDGKSFNTSAVHTQATNVSPSSTVDSSSSFLASLFALLIPLRYSLSQKPIGTTADGAKNEIVRVVVMTGNPTVAKKLIFILNGLIPDSDLSIELNGSAEEIYPQDNSALLDDFEESDDDDFSIGSPLYSPPPVEARIIPQNRTTTSTPIPIQKAEFSSSYGSSDNSVNKSTPSMKGWEIPQKSGPSTKATSGKSRINVTTQNIPIENSSGSQGSISKSSSMAHLSSSLNSSLSSSHSSYSLSKLGGSFMEKWKNSFNGIQGQGAMNNFIEGPDLSQPSSCGVLYKRQSFQSLRTPSPAFEVDDFPLPQGSTGSSMSMRMSRSHSMVDLLSKVNLEHRSLDLKRSKTSLIMPLTNDNIIKNVEEHNRAAIKTKCSNIMKKNFSVNVLSNKSLSVQPMNLNYSNSETSMKSKTSGPVIYKYKPLLPAVAFTDEFRPEFTLQSCPTSPKVETQVINAMKNDLIMNKNFLDGENVASKTILINLRAREIKHIHMHMNPQKKKQISPISTLAHPGNSPEETIPKSMSSNSNLSYSTNIKKVYTPYKNIGDRQHIIYIESVFEEICNIVIKRTKGAHIDNFEEKLSNLISNLFK